MKWSRLSLIFLCSLFLIVISACNGEAEPTPSPGRSHNPPDEHNVDCGISNLIATIELAGPNGVIINLAQCQYILTEINNTSSSTDGGSYGGTGLPVINVPVTINGIGNASIMRSDADGTPIFRLFLVTENGKLVLNDLDLFNGATDKDLGGIDLGGAVLNDGGALEINNCTLENHTATEGGAICSRGGETLIRYSHFSGNSAEQFGGSC